MVAPRRVLGALCLLAALFSGALVHATDYTVSSFKTSAIQALVDTVVDGDTILLPAGTYVDDEHGIYFTSGIKRFVGLGTGAIIQSNSSYTGSGYQFYANVAASMYLENIHIKDAPSASAVNAYGTGTLTIVRCTFTNNRGYAGGAIQTSLSVSTIIESTFIGNRADYKCSLTNGGCDTVIGGAVAFYVNAVDSTLLNSTFIDNYASYGNEVTAGGAILMYGCRLTINNVTATGSRAGKGGFLAVAYGVAFLLNSHIEVAAPSNIAGAGTGVYIATGQVTVSNTRFTAPASSAATANGASVIEGGFRQGQPGASLNVFNSSITNIPMTAVGISGAFVNVLVDHLTVTGTTLPSTPINFCSRDYNGGFLVMTPDASSAAATFRSVVGSNIRVTSTTVAGGALAVIDGTQQNSVSFVGASFDTISAPMGVGTVISSAGFLVRGAALSLSLTNVTHASGGYGVVAALGTSRVTFDTVLLSNNVATNGGAVYCDGCNLRGGGLVLTNNSAVTGAALTCVNNGIIDATVSFHDNGNDGSLFSTSCASCGCCATQAAAPVSVVTSTCGGLSQQACNYTCARGYVETGRQPQCGVGGAWTTAGVCQGLPCGIPPTVDHAVRVLSGTGISGDTATYACNEAEGYVPANNTVLTCISPNWEGQVPFCVYGQCTNLRAPANGSISATAVSFYSNVTYDCPLGLMLVGDRERTCTVNHTLSGDDPTCEPAKCDTLANNVYNSCGQEGIAIGSTCTIQCLAGHAGPAGVTATCALGAAGYRGEFLPAPPACTLCGIGLFAAPGALLCQSCPNGFTESLGASSQAECQCDAGFFEQTPGAGDCVACPEGARCAGGKTQPAAITGYYQSGLSFIQCTPPEACLGNGTCATGYRGYLCGACSSGFYQLSGRCEVCPDEGPWKIIVAIFGLLILALMLVKVQSKSSSSSASVNFAAPTIGFSFAQVTGAFLDINFPWPQQMRDFMNGLSSLNLNIGLINPECSLPMTFWDKLQAELILPIVLFLFFVFVVGVLMLKAYFRDHLVEGLFRRHAKAIVANFISGYLLIMTILYMFLAQGTVAFFSCTARPDGTSTLAQAPDLHCFQDKWYQLLPLAIFSLVFYVIGIPLSLTVIFIRIRSKNGFLTAASHPLTSFFVSKYEHKFWYWECLIMLRKFLIVLVSAVYISSPNVTAVLCIVILFVAAMLTIAFRPFLWDKHDFVEISSLVASLVVLFVGLLTTSQGTGPKVQIALAIISIVVTAFALGAMILCFLSEIYVKFYLFRHAQKLGDATRRTLFGHRQAVSCIALANQGTLVTGSEDCSLRVWNAMTGECVRVIKAHRGGVAEVITIRKNYVISAGHEGDVKLWNVRSGRCVRVLARNLGRIECLGVSAAALGQIMAVGTKEGKLFIWRENPGQITALSAEESDESGSELLEEPVNLLAQVKGLVGLDTLKTGREDFSEHSYSDRDEPDLFLQTQAIADAHKGGVYAVMVHGTHVFSGGHDKTTRLWSLKRDVSHKHWVVHSGPVTTITEHKRILYTGSEDSTIRAISLANDEIVRTYSGHQGTITCLAVEATTGTLLSASFDNTIRVWDLEEGTFLHNLTGHTLAVNAFILGYYEGLRPMSEFVANMGLNKLLMNDRKHSKDASGLSLQSGGSRSRDAASHSSSDDSAGFKVHKDAEAGAHHGISPVIGVLYSASDDLTIRAFELNLRRTLKIEDPFEVLGARAAACLPSFKEPELNVHGSNDLSSLSASDSADLGARTHTYGRPSTRQRTAVATYMAELEASHSGAGTSHSLSHSHSRSGTRSDGGRRASRAGEQSRSESSAWRVARSAASGGGSGSNDRRSKSMSHTASRSASSST